MTATEPLAAPEYIQPIAELFRPGCSALWATTFNLELELFNEYLLGRLGEPPLNAVIVCDRDRLDKALNAIPVERLSLLNPTNRRYLLRGARLGGGRFHPKSYLAVTGRSAQLLVGSGNLSSNGIDLGREVFTAFTSGTTTGDAAIAIWRQWMRQIVQRIDDTLLAERFADLENRLPSPPPVAPVIDPPLLHNLQRPLLAQFVERVGESPVDELIVTAPFYDETGEALGRLATQLKPSVIRLYFTATTSVDGTALAQRLSATSATVETLGYVPDRFTHAKLIGVTRGDSGWLMSGSANLSRAALTLDAAAGNTELAVITELPADKLRAAFLPPEVTATTRDLQSLADLRFDQSEQTPDAAPVRLIRASAGRDGVAVITEPPLQPGWHLADHERRLALRARGGQSVTDGALTGPVVHITDPDGLRLSGPAVIDDPSALDRQLHQSDEHSGSHKPPELTDADLDTPLGAALLHLHRTLVMDVSERPTTASGGGLSSDEAGSEGDDSLWERLEKETLQRDPRAGAYGRLVGRGQDNRAMNEQIIELLEAMRARVPAGLLDNQAASVLSLINRANQHRGDPTGHHWSTNARVRLRTRNVLRRWAAAQTDPRLAWVDPVAPLVNLSLVAAVFAQLWQAQAAPGAVIELDPDDLDDLWARWFQPFVGTGHGDGWIDRSELTAEQLQQLGGASLSENITLLCWLAIRPGDDRRSRIITWQPALGAAWDHGLINDSPEVATAVSTVLAHPVPPGRVGDDIFDALTFIDDDLWCARTADSLEIAKLRIAALAPDQAIQMVLHVSGIADGLQDSRLPALIAAIRRYRSVDRVAVYSDDYNWRLGATADEPAWYRHPDQTLSETAPLSAGAIESLIASSGVLAGLFATSQVA